MDEILESIGHVEQGQPGETNGLQALMNPFCVADELQFAEIHRQVRARIGTILGERPLGEGNVLHPQIRESFQMIMQDQMQFQAKMKQLDTQIQQHKQEIITESKEQGVDLKANLQQIEKMILGQINQKQVVSEQIIQPVYYSSPVFFHLLRLSLCERMGGVSSETLQKQTIAASSDINEMEQVLASQCQRQNEVTKRQEAAFGELMDQYVEVFRAKVDGVKVVYQR